MATLGQQSARILRQNRRLQEYEDYDDLTMLKRVMSNQGNPSIELSRDLTIEDKIKKSKESGITENFNQINAYILDKDNNLRNDLSDKDIKQLKGHVEGIRKSSSALYNQENNFELENQINNMSVNLMESLNTLERNNKIERSFIGLEKAIENLGDPMESEDGLYVSRGDYSITGKGSMQEGTKFILDNVKRLGENTRSVGGEKAFKLFEPFTEKLEKQVNEKFALFENMNYYTRGEGANDILSSPKAKAKFKEALRLFNTKGEEDVTKIQKLLDELPALIGARDLKLSDNELSTREKLKESDEKAYDTRVSTKLKQFKGAAIGYKDKKFAESIFGANEPRQGAFNDKETSIDYVENTIEPLILNVLSEGIKEIKNVKDPDKNFDINTAVEQNDFATIMQYFLDETPYKDPKDKSIKTYGDARLKGIKTTKGVRAQNKAANYLRNGLQLIQLIRNQHGYRETIPLNDLMGALDKDNDGTPDTIDIDGGIER